MENTKNNLKNEKNISNELKKHHKNIDDIDKKIEELKSKLEYSKKNIHDIKLRQLAEIENIEKNVKNKIQKIKQTEQEIFLKKILSIIDQLEETLSISEKIELKNEPVIEGINLTLQSLWSNISKLGVFLVGQKNEAFDSNIHDSLSEKFSTTIPVNHIMHVHKKGYVWNKIVLRKAVVTISKKEK
ncbi:nucleotide exchange factor GrpE [Buchnera aphidicola]|uniref:nucleotide exchange factor GrpE n=1 Tax=Buchnera aphidicola TaxID=9 RepID=UPI003BEECA5B